MKQKLLCFLLFIIAAYHSDAQTHLDDNAKTHSTEFGIQTDNDSYLLQGSDRYYTDGLFIYYRHALNTASNSNLQNKVLGFEIGQKIFNPQSGSISFNGVDDPKYIDRPFAGYLYAGANLNFLYNNESNIKVGAQVGVVGPAALGKQVQDYVHDNFGFYHPSGWEYQVDNNFQLNLSAEYNRLIGRTNFGDLSVASYGNLGTGFTGAGIGPLIRIGNVNQLFNSVSTQSTAINNSRLVTPLHRFELFLYYKPQFNYVAYDATVQGSLFSHKAADSEEVLETPERFVLSQQIGLAYSGSRFVVDAAAIIHSKDVKQMIRSHQWGSVTLLYRFN